MQQESRHLDGAAGTWMSAGTCFNFAEEMEWRILLLADAHVRVAESILNQSRRSVLRILSQ